MEKWTLICDESGAKGFNDRPARNDENIGIVAGVLATDEKLHKIRAELSKINTGISQSAKKIHISDMNMQLQETFRSKIFKILENIKPIVIYDAVSQNTFHEKYLLEKDFFDTLKATAQKNGFGWNSGSDKKRMQTILFLGCLIRSLDYLFRIDPRYNFELELLTDTLDAPIAKEIRKEIKEFLSFSKEQSHKNITHYNYKKKRTETWRGTITYSLNIDGEIDDLTPRIKFSMRQDSQISIFADVLSNSILHTINTAYTNNSNIILTSRDAIFLHPLIGLFESLTVDPNNDITRKLYHSILEGKNSLQEKIDFVRGLAVDTKVTPDSIKES